MTFCRELEREIFFIKASRVHQVFSLHILLPGSKHLLHLVEGGSGLEPLDLLLVEGVVEGDLFGAAVVVLQGCNNRLEKGHLILKQSSIIAGLTTETIYSQTNLQRQWLCQHPQLARVTHTGHKFNFIKSVFVEFESSTWEMNNRFGPLCKLDHFRKQIYLIAVQLRLIPYRF